DLGREVAGRGNHILGCAILQRCTPVTAATQAQPESHLGYSLPSWTAPTASTLSAASTASRKARPASSTAFFRAAHSKATASRWSLSVTIYSPPSTVLSPWGSDTRPALTARYKSDRLICASMEVLMDIPASTSSPAVNNSLLRASMA